MRNARVKLSLLILALAWTGGSLRHWSGTEGWAFAQQPSAVQAGPAEAETVLTGDASAPFDFQCIPAPFAACGATAGPAWYFQIEGLALKRDASRSQMFQAFVERVWTETDPPGWEATDFVTGVLGTGSLHFGFQGGARALVGRTLGQCSAFEVSYFELTDWDEAAAVRDATDFIQQVDANGDPTVVFPASLFSPFSDFGDPPIPGLDYNNLAYLGYESTLNNLEWNLRRWILADPRRLTASVLVGGRYMNIDERFNYYTESVEPAGASVDVTTDTDNKMIGVQIGAMFEFFVDTDPGWWIDCEIKGGVFTNDAGQRTVFTPDNVPDYPDNPGGYVGSRDETITSWVLDLRLNATVLVTPRLAVIGGYHALWLDGLALASENMSQNSDVLFDGPAMLVDDGKVVYHGPHLGLTWVW